jgi:hypothetical protein
MMKVYFSIFSGMMNAAAPKGRPRGGSPTNIPKELPVPPCLGEALRRAMLKNNGYPRKEQYSLGYF